MAEAFARCTFLGIDNHEAFEPMAGDRLEGNLNRSAGPTTACPR
jgi:hypothetical protein